MQNMGSDTVLNSKPGHRDSCIKRLPGLDHAIDQVSKPAHAIQDGICLDSRIKRNMIEVIRRCLVEKLLRSLKVKTFSWPGIQQPRNVVQSDLAHA